MGRIRWTSARLRVAVGDRSSTAEPREEVQEILDGREPGEEVTSAIEDRLTAERCCPHCGTGSGVKRGSANGLRRYRCKACGKSFNALTGTPLARLRHKERWLDFAQSLKEGDTVRASAGRCDVAVGTAFRWRHRFLRALETATAPLRGTSSKPTKPTFWTVAREIDSSIVSPASVAARRPSAACRANRCQSWWRPTVAAPRSARRCRRCLPSHPGGAGTRHRQGCSARH